MRIARATAIVLAVVALAGCSASPEVASGSATTQVNVIADDATPRDGGVLEIGVQNETAGWNPRVAQWGGASAIVGSSVLEPLMMADAKAEWKPWLAESVTANATEDVWTVKVRPGITFHDGEPLDAAAVKLNFDDLVEAPVTNLAYGSMLKSFTIVDDRTVEAHLGQPWAAFPAFLAQSGASMLAPAMINAAGKGQDHPIGTGPFVFDGWKRDDTFKAKKNPSYWRPGEPHLDGVEFKVLVDQSAQSGALRSGNVDLIFNSIAESSEHLDPGFQVIREWATQPQVIVTSTAPEVNGEPNPAANGHLRQAMAAATDRVAVAEAAGDGIGSPTSPFSAENPWGQPDEQNGYPSFDLERAKHEVAAYQAETGAGPPKLAVKYPTEDRLTRVLQLVQQQWKQAGIDLQLRPTEATTMVTDAVAGNYQLAVLPIYTFPDPDTYYLFWISTNAKGPGQINLNFSQYKSATIDQNLSLARQTSDVARRKAAYSDIVRELNSQALDLWLYWTPLTMIAAPKVRGLNVIRDDPFGDYDMKTWYGRLWLA